MARRHKDMTYRELQKYNSTLVSQHCLNQKRKSQGLLNRGWQQVIQLYEWLMMQLADIENASDVESKILSNFAKMQKAATAIKNTVSKVRKKSQKWQHTGIINNIREFDIRDNCDDSDGNMPATL